MKLEALERNIEPHEIEWKVQSYTKKEHTIIVPYVTSRCVMDRLDEQFGVLNWKTAYTEVNSGMLCTLSVRIDTNEEWVSKTDGASLTKIEPIKGAISDALKRAAHQFGLGRCLYSYPRIIVATKLTYIPGKLIDTLSQMVEKFNAGNLKTDVVNFTEEQYSSIINQYQNK